MLNLNVVKSLMSQKKLNKKLIVEIILIGLLMFLIAMVFVNV